MTTYSSSFREVGDNLVLARYQNTVEIPAAENSLIVSEYPIPGSETQKSTLRLTTTTPTTPEHQTKHILESDEPPTESETILNILEDQNKWRQAISPDTSDMFDQYLRVPVNETTIQTPIVPPLININMGGIILDSKTHATVEA
ncbi:unnamed protein product [Penicillium camemberti]|uniref:Str. FM013 n=1 Tax=Penicillium camemberti (strain FM 013) TaxID=1429867 RepID=A0A0G4PHS9_PENC3|nr:unnamed protein product [Penicillium camemberti]